MSITTVLRGNALRRLGAWVTAKYQTQQAEKGTFQAALNMKKQGYPIEFALQVLVFK